MRATPRWRNWLVREARLPFFLTKTTRRGRDGNALAARRWCRWFARTATAPLASNRSAEIDELGPRDSPEMVELTTLTKPGPFGSRTHELGYYVGIRQEGKLVAMAGERLKVPGYTEVSAVCTHPDYLGRGYAGALMTEVMQQIRERGETPFLHVRADNARAIALYERLGFRIRHRGYFAVLRIC